MTRWKGGVRGGVREGKLRGWRIPSGGGGDIR